MKRILVVALLAIWASVTRADVKLPPVIGDHMVLQRDMAVPIWGTATPSEKVTVKFKDQSKSTEADKDGKWLVKLDPLKASAEPAVLEINGKKVNDVLVGEVWVGSGQSNMQGNVGGYAKNDPMLAKILAGAPYPQVRQASANGGWREATPANLGGFSAILFSFGLRLNQELGIPVGLLHGSVGGTPSGFWLSEEAFKEDAPTQEMIKNALAKWDDSAEKQKYDAAVAKWEKDVETAKKENKPAPRKPDYARPGEARGKIGNLYQAHIRGFLPFAVRGVLWDQGESGTAINAVDQYTLMGALIKGWRKEWGQDFAFLYVQKPSGDGCAWDPENPTTNRASPFAKLPPVVPANGQYRELHIKIRNYPNTFMVESSDLGSGIHPTNKSGYGDRASRVALGGVYGKKIEIYGPVFESHTIDGDKVKIKFSHAGQGLAYKHGDKLQGFAIAGDDKKFIWADAVIIGDDTVVVSHPDIKKPAAVRYAYNQQHPWANLFNKDGLPAQAFRTDAW